MNAFKAQFWPTLRQLEHEQWMDSVGFTSLWFAKRAAGVLTTDRDPSLDKPFHHAAFEFLWEAVRVGILVPTRLEGHVHYIPRQECSFAFTALGSRWRQHRNEEDTNPFADDFERTLLELADILRDEPIMLITEARLAHRAGLMRAALFLLGLMNEDVCDRLFEAGVTSTRVTPAKTKRNPGKAWAIQEDVHDALVKLEGTTVSKGFAGEWHSLANTMRQYRNDCAHDAAFLPSSDVLFAAMFMLPRYARLSQIAYVALK